MNTIRRVGSSRGIRKVALNPRVRRAGAAVLGARFLVSAIQLDTPGRFLINEAFKRGEIELYRLRQGMPLALQHGRDAEALFELFTRGEYEPPAVLASRFTTEKVRRVVDVGANVGMFSAWAALKWPQAHVTAFEPIESNCRVYRRWAAASQANVELIEAAAGASEGSANFVDLGGGSFQADGDDQGVTVPIVDVFPTLLDADFIKIDIEGGEWPLLADPRMAALNAVLVMEYHRVGSPSLPARAAAEDLLQAAGFETGFGQHNHWGHGTLWAWKV
jgi:FkbM family methyltransferase